MRTRKKKAKQRGCKNCRQKRKKKKNSFVIIPRSVSRGIFYVCPKKTRKRGNYWTYETYDCAFVSVEYQRHCFRFGNERRPQPRSSSSVFKKKRKHEERERKREKELQLQFVSDGEEKIKRRNAMNAFRTMHKKRKKKKKKTKKNRKKNLTRRPNGSCSDTETAEENRTKDTSIRKSFS